MTRGGRPKGGPQAKWGLGLALLGAIAVGVWFGLARSQGGSSNGLVPTGVVEHEFRDGGRLGLPELPGQSVGERVLETTSAPEARGTFEVRSATDLALVLDVEVELMSSAEGQRLRAKSGIFQLDPQETAGLEGLAAVVEAPGFCRRLVWLPISLDATVVELFPSADLAIRLTNEVGTPVVKGEVVLVPPLVDEEPWTRDWTFFANAEVPSRVERLRKQAARLDRPMGRAEFAEIMGVVAPTESSRGLLAPGPLSSFEVVRDCLETGGWTQVTGDDGYVRWSGLPAMPGYSWACPDLAVARYDPKLEVQDLRREDGVIEITDDQRAEDISGAFRLAPGALRTLHGVIVEQSRVLGHLAEADPIDGESPVVKVIGYLSAADTKKRGMGKLTNDAQTWARKDGSFEMTGILPGLKHLYAWWRGKDGDVYFIDERFELALGETLDLGELYVHKGLPWEVVLNLLDEDGNVLPVLETLELKEPPLVNVTALFDGWVPGGENIIAEHFVVPLGGTIKFWGLPPGRGDFSGGWFEGGGPHGSAITREAAFHFDLHHGETHPETRTPIDISVTMVRPKSPSGHE